MDDLEFRIAKVRISPGDILVVKAKGKLSVESCRRIHDKASEKLPPDVKVIVIDTDVDLAILTRAEIEARA